MSTVDAGRLHHVYGKSRARISFQKGDFVDYTLMVLITWLVLDLAYGSGNLMSRIGAVLCVFMIAVFPLRHGLAFKLPALVRKPQDVFYLVLYKLENIKPLYLFALALLLLENYFIYLTPRWPHHVELMRTIAIWLFYIHFGAISLFRTAILFAHLYKRELAREVLRRTAWSSALLRQPSIVLEILHAYCTGLLAHMVLVAPWFLVIKYLSFSVLAAPVIIAINAVTYVKYMESYSLWFYRDHWLGHNSEIDFLYLHGAHHDAIPTGLIGVSGNGYLEGFMRHSLGVPTAFYNPIFSFVLYTWDVQADMRYHQYIPGIWPRLPRRFHQTAQHSTHHYGHLSPYSIGLRLGKPKATTGKKKRFSIYPQSAMNSIELDEELSGFQWDSPRYRHFLDLYDQYDKR